MTTYKFGEIVLIKFPFTDNITFKKRPALVIKDTNDGDIIVCRITSKTYNSIYDIELDTWAQHGLKLPSIIRVHKMTSLEKTMIDIKFGEIDDTAKAKVIDIIRKLFDK